MFSFTFFLIFIPILTIILLVINLLFATHKPYQEKNNPFECGFDSFTDQNREEAEIGYFVFALLFMIVDIELIAVAPVLVNFKQNEGYGLIILIIFVVILAIGFMYEIGKNVLYIPSRQFDISYTNKREKATLATLATLGIKIKRYFTFVYYKELLTYCTKLFYFPVIVLIKLVQLFYFIYTYLMGEVDPGLLISFFDNDSDGVSSDRDFEDTNNKRPLSDDNSEESKTKRAKYNQDMYSDQEVRKVVSDLKEGPQHPDDVYKGREYTKNITKEQLLKEDSQHPEYIAKEESDYAEDTSNLDLSILDPSKIDPKKEEPWFNWVRDWFSKDTGEYHGNTNPLTDKPGEKWKTKYPPTEFEDKYPENIDEAYTEKTTQSEEITKPNRNIPGGDQKLEDEKLTDLRNAVIKSSKERDEADNWNEDPDGAIARKHERAVDDLRKYLNDNSKANFRFDRINSTDKNVEMSHDSEHNE